MNIECVNDIQQKQRITREVLEALPEWFEIEEGRENYIRESVDKIFFCAEENGEMIGFVYLSPTSRDTVELAVIGVLKEYHRKGIGRMLFENAKKAAVEGGYSFMQVKTIKMGMYEDYDRTNRFYLSLGFKEFEIFPDLWDEANPCQIYVMAI